MLKQFVVLSCVDFFNKMTSKNLNLMQHCKTCWCLDEGKFPFYFRAIWLVNFFLLFTQLSLCKQRKSINRRQVEEGWVGLGGVGGPCLTKSPAYPPSIDVPCLRLCCSKSGFYSTTKNWLAHKNQSKKVASRGKTCFWVKKLKLKWSIKKPLKSTKTTTLNTTPKYNPKRRDDDTRCLLLRHYIQLTKAPRELRLLLLQYATNHYHLCQQYETLYP